MKELDKIYAQNVANEYTKKTEPKVVALKKLDRKAKMPAYIFAYTFGIVFLLILGVGMCFSLKVIGSSNTMFIVGIIIGSIGIIGVSVNYPIYKKILIKNKEKYAEDIIELAKEITEK